MTPREQGREREARKSRRRDVGRKMRSSVGELQGCRGRGARVRGKKQTGGMREAGQRKARWQDGRTRGQEGWWVRGGRVLARQRNREVI